VLVRVRREPSLIDRVLRREAAELRLVRNVIEADEETGQLTMQLTDTQGNLLYTNGVDDIAINNTVKLLMLLGQVRSVFIEAGFVPKIQTTYEQVVLRKRA